ncbi:hypothetical protein [Granulicoccus phenolivorans]|uniref:hypothetical protein n=1 Tax=Granulicoccus phenolivorans TaxID=266854 RepID=UPI00041094C1|nr:hypothetical protein [Granulicoccus phenolivorans]
MSQDPKSQDPMSPEDEEFLRRALGTQAATDPLAPEPLIARGRRRRSRRRLQIAGAVCGVLVIAGAVGVGVGVGRDPGRVTSAAAPERPAPSPAEAGSPTDRQASAGPPAAASGRRSPVPSRSIGRGQELAPGHTLTWDEQQWCVANAEQGETCRPWGPGAVGYRHQVEQGTVLVISLPTAYQRVDVIAPDQSRVPAEIWEIPGRPQNHLVTAVVAPRLGTAPVQLEVLDSGGQTRSITIN